MVLHQNLKIGKHNDLDNVGFTNRHHTLFQMLGNFVFESNVDRQLHLQEAWEFLTGELGIQKNKLRTT